MYGVTKHRGTLFIPGGPGNVVHQAMGTSGRTEALRPLCSPAAASRVLCRHPPAAVLGHREEGEFDAHSMPSGKAQSHYTVAVIFWEASLLPGTAKGSGTNSAPRRAVLTPYNSTVSVDILLPPLPSLLPSFFGDSLFLSLYFPLLPTIFSFPPPFFPTHLCIIHFPETVKLSNPGMASWLTVTRTLVLGWPVVWSAACWAGASSLHLGLTSPITL